jgi:ribonucleoside-diphosphate reductase beta chain
MSVFNKNKVDHMIQPLFFGEELNVARTETVKHKVIDDLTNKQLGFFWRPTEVNLMKDVIDYELLADHEKHMFLANLKYQSLLDSVQGRAPTMAFLPICSDPCYERWIETWAFSETIHSESYTHILRTVLPTSATAVFDSIIDTKEIMQRATSIGGYYDDLIRHNCMRELALPEYDEYAHKKALYLCMHAVNALEAIRFYVSFAITFSFGERKIMEGVAKTISLIARDEALHLKGTQWTIRQWQRGLEGTEWKQIADECHNEAVAIFETAKTEEKDWGVYLMSLGAVVGLNTKIINDYIDYIANQRMRAVGLLSEETVITKNPLPWMNNWLKTDDRQVAPQETEVTTYITAGLDVTNLDFAGML